MPIQRSRFSASVIYVVAGFGLALTSVRAAEQSQPASPPGEQALSEYFRHETAKLSAACLADVHSLADWNEHRDEYRRQLHEMLGLDPLPERTPLHPVITGTLDHAEFTVEKLHFQSRPGLYVTGNLYIPKGLKQPAPAVLYVCGHGNIEKDGTSYGSKARYQHHPAWFARHGFVSLILDTLELGEIRGVHHGTYNQNRWWWNARGYTPAGVEAFNAIRAIDYLQSRKEVDPERIGVTGRSGGGASSWWISALDERVKAAVPVAGITDLKNHVVDGRVEGHCDCMFIVNTYRWDYAQVAALVSPRQLLLGNTDADGIFPLDGVERVDNHLRRIYKLHGAEKSLGLQISPGPHRDLQELQVAALHWFNRFLMHEEPLIQDAAVPFFQPEELKVFGKDEVPADQLNTTIDETFVPLAPPPEVPQGTAQWLRQSAQWRAALESKVFAGWPRDAGPLNAREIRRATQSAMELTLYEFTSQADVTLRMHLLRPAGLEKPTETILTICDQPAWDEWLAMISSNFGDQLQDESPVRPNPEGFDFLSRLATATRAQLAFLAPRGIGRSAWSQTPKKQTHIRRRFMLLGQTLEGMQVWDARRAMQTMRGLPQQQDVPLSLSGRGDMAGIALYASLLEPPVAELRLSGLPSSHRVGPNFLNVLRFLDMPAALAMAAERARVTLSDSDPDDWKYPRAVANRLNWKPDQLQFESAE